MKRQRDPLTPRQRELVMFVCRFAREQGRAPTMVEAAQFMGVSKTATLRLAARAVAAGQMHHEPRSKGTWVATVDQKPATRRRRAAR